MSSTTRGAASGPVPRISACLPWPGGTTRRTFSSLAAGRSGVRVSTGFERARCEQEVPGGRDIYELPLPAVVSVLEGINLPRYPSVPAKLRARSKPVETRTPERPAARLEKLRLVVPPGQGKQAEILGTGPEAAPRVVELMREIGVAG